MSRPHDSVGRSYPKYKTPGFSGSKTGRASIPGVIDRVGLGGSFLVFLAQIFSPAGAAAFFSILLLQGIFVSEGRAQSGTPGLMVLRTALSLTEADEAGDEDTETYTVRLSTAPSPGMTVTVTPTLTTEITALVVVTPTALTFTSTDWNMGKEVRVTTRPDLIDSRPSILCPNDGSTNSECSTNSSRTVTISHSMTATSGSYDGLTGLRAVAVTVPEDDEARLSITRDGRTPFPAGNPVILAPGDEFTYSLRLITQPTSNVTVTRSAENLAGRLEGMPTSVTFTPSNWQTTFRTVVGFRGRSQPAMPAGRRFGANL